VNAIRWLVSSRFRRLCRARVERSRRNRARAAREFRALRKRLMDEYIVAEDYGDARRLLQLIMKMDITAEIHGIDLAEPTPGKVLA
jgi:hypothetical protein